MNSILSVCGVFSSNTVLTKIINYEAIMLRFFGSFVGTVKILLFGRPEQLLKNPPSTSAFFLSSLLLLYGRETHLIIHLWFQLKESFHIFFDLLKITIISIKKHLRKMG